MKIVKNEDYIESHKSSPFVCSTEVAQNVREIIFKKIKGWAKLDYYAKAIYLITHIRYFEPYSCNEECYAKFDDLYIRLRTRPMIIDQTPDGDPGETIHTFKPICILENQILWINDEINLEANGIPYLMKTYINKKYIDECVVFLSVRETDCTNFEDFSDDIKENLRSARTFINI